jgi:osmotically-inducible protein OsmY
MFKLLVGAVIGGAAVWFLDPDRGEGRRGQALSYAKKGKDQAAQAGESLSETAQTAAQTVQDQASSDDSPEERTPPSERLNDPALQAKVESEIFRAADAPKDRVSVNVEDGVVYLRGQLDDPAAVETLREAASKVEGVRGVESLLHGPGEPAPAKDESHG